MAPRGTSRQIAEELRRRVVAGDLKPGTMLPSEQELARDLAVSRGTVRSALSSLADAGLVEVVPGQGRRVAGADASAVVATAWERVASDLRGRMRADSTNLQQLPSESELAIQHRVSRNTVRRAYRQLIEEGLVIVRHGAGAFPVQRHDERSP